MSKSSLDRLVYMANQIARNVATFPDPAATTADHIASFWDPRMKAMIFDHLAAADGAGLDPVALQALHGLSIAGAPPPQTRATQSGASDAG